MQLSDLQVLIAKLCNDPSNTRYDVSDINTELDNTQGDWNQEIKVIKETTTITTIANQRQYAITLITGTPIAFPRATHKGLKLSKRSKSYFDLYARGNDWTQAIGTPTDFIVEGTDPANLFLTVYPTPQSGDAGANLVVEATIAHTPMAAATDVPFMLGATSNYLLRPFDFYLAYSAAPRLLARDPSPENSQRSGSYLSVAQKGKESLIDVFKQMESEEPLRFRGGRTW